MTVGVSGGTAPGRGRALTWPGWRAAAGYTALGGGVTVAAGCLLPWVTVFAGLVPIRGTSGGNGQILALTGAVIAAAGTWHLIRGGAISRWLTGILGAVVTGDAGYLLLRLTSTLQVGDSMTILRGGPGLWVVAAGGLSAFGTLFFPASSQTSFVAHASGAGVAAWSADRVSRGARRGLQVALGAVWLLDGVLQLQPFMFSRGFVTQVIDPAAMGNPAVVATSVMGAGQIMATHIAVANAAFAATQLAIGAGLLWRATTRAALTATIAWAIGVWWLGEGLGGVLTGSASPVTGAPGAALLYAVIAVLAWPSSRSNPGTRAAKAVWAVLWAGFACLMLQPAVRAPGALRASVAGQTAGEPGWVAGLDHWAARAIGSGSATVCVILAALFLVIGAGVLLPATTRAILTLAAATALTIWVLGQDFGGMFTGRGTDPSTGPLLILLTAACWPWRPHTTAHPESATPQDHAQPRGTAAMVNSRV